MKREIIVTNILITLRCIDQRKQIWCERYKYHSWGVKRLSAEIHRNNKHKSEKLQESVSVWN